MDVAILTEYRLRHIINYKVLKHSDVFVDLLNSLRHIINYKVLKLF